jgi:hypothetical protein
VEAGKELAKYKQQLDKKVEEHKSGLSQKVGEHLAQVNSKQDVLEQRLSKRWQAYDELYRAANGCYYTLAKLEVGSWSAQRGEQADQLMIEASAYLRHLPEDHRKLWRDQFWQKARTISETADSLPSGDSAAYEQLWRDVYKDFGGLFLAFEEEANRVLQQQAYESD